MTRRVPSVADLRAAVFPCVAATLIASAGGCRPSYPACGQDDDCREREYCVQQQCQQCRDTADCRTGERCVDGRCEVPSGACRSDGDCNEGARCQAGRCTEPDPDEGSAGAVGTDAARACRLVDVRFAYDDASLDDAARDALEANARCIRERQIGNVALVGHADPRGTEEYNLALGERRAKTVRDYLADLGVSAAEVTVSSLGEELASGADEAGWAADRRVEVLSDDDSASGGGMLR